MTPDRPALVKALAPAEEPGPVRWSDRAWVPAQEPAPEPDPASDRARPARCCRTRRRARASPPRTGRIAMIALVLRFLQEPHVRTRGADPATSAVGAAPVRAERMLLAA